VNASGTHPLADHRIRRICVLCVVLASICLAARAEPGDEEDRSPTATSPAASQSASIATASPPAAAADPESRPIAAYGAGERPIDPRVSARSEDPLSMAGSVAVRLALVLALVVACAVAWRRLQSAMPQPAAGGPEGLQILGTASLAPQRSIHLVSVGSHRLLIGSSPQQVSLLAHLEGGTAVRGAQCDVRGEDGVEVALVAAQGDAARPYTADRPTNTCTAHRAPRIPRPARERSEHRIAHGNEATDDEERFEDLVAWVRAIDLREQEIEETEPALAAAAGAPDAEPAAGGRRWLVESARGSRYEVATETEMPRTGNGASRAVGAKSLFRVVPGADPEGRDG